MVKGTVILFVHEIYVSVLTFLLSTGSDKNKKEFLLHLIILSE